MAGTGDVGRSEGLVTTRSAALSEARGLTRSSKDLRQSIPDVVAEKKRFHPICPPASGSVWGFRKGLVLAGPLDVSESVYVGVALCRFDDFSGHVETAISARRL